MSEPKTYLEFRVLVPMNTVVPRLSAIATAKAKLERALVDDLEDAIIRRDPQVVER